MEVATKDIYTWQVTYRDGWIVPEFDAAHPGGRGCASVDVRQVATIELLQDGKIAHKMSVPPGAIPVFARRRTIELNPDTNEQKSSTAHCIGYIHDTPVSYPCYLFVFEDGSTLLTDNFQAV